MLTSTCSSETNGQIQAGSGVCRCQVGNAGESVGVGYATSAYASSFLPSDASLEGSIFGRSFVKSPGSFANETALIVGGGFVEVQNPAKYGLRGGFPISNTDKEIYSISMFHQIYCLVRQILIPFQCILTICSIRFPPFTKCCG